MSDGAGTTNFYSFPLDNVSRACDAVVERRAWGCAFSGWGESTSPVYFNCLKHADSLPPACGLLPVYAANERAATPALV